MSVLLDFTCLLAMDDLREPYQRVDTVHAGEPLTLPEPFGIKLDTGALFG